MKHVEQPVFKEDDLYLIPPSGIPKMFWIKNENPFSIYLFKKDKLLAIAGFKRKLK